MVKLDRHYVDPRLVAIYDIENPDGPDAAFYRWLADSLDAKRIIDLGCGTGLLTRRLVGPGREIIGVDPAAEMLAYAKCQPGADPVHWIEGDAGVLGKPDADLLIMTGHVAQVFLDDGDWIRTLTLIRAALRTGGYLAFESGNPEARGWEAWNRADSYARFESPEGAFESWVDVVDVSGDQVRFEGHTIFADDGEDRIVESELRFRGQNEINESLSMAGFRVEQVYGSWQREPFNKTSREMIFVAGRDDKAQP